MHLHNTHRTKDTPTDTLVQHKIHLGQAGIELNLKCTNFCCSFGAIANAIGPQGSTHGPRGPCVETAKFGD